MPTLQEIKKNLETISALKDITGTYQEIANLRMKQIRELVLKNRKFFQELLSTYQKIKSAYFLSLKRKRGGKIFFRQAKKEKILVFLSSNQFFYGPLILNIWKKVKKYLSQNKGDLAIIGRTGKYLAEREGFGLRIFYFELNDLKPEKEKLEEIIAFIKNYKKILVFHGKYAGVLNQDVVINDLSGEIIPGEKDLKGEDYIFEPSPEAVLEFFETEMIASLFNQTLMEHQLARYASRVIAMYQASENAKKLEKKFLIIKNKLIRQKLNKKQIELFSNLLCKGKLSQF
jgi:F-type H+-transporting ATPase subunit gamma